MLVDMYEFHQKIPPQAENGRRLVCTMAHKEIKIKNIAFEIPHKDCFSAFSTTIKFGEKIGVIGRNGSGKSSLLKMIVGKMEPSAGEISGLDDVSIGYVPQTILEHDNMSGGERFNRSFSEALSNYPDILVLDEPTNHLDQATRDSMMRMLNNYDGTLIVATHDTKILNMCVNKLWHIDNGRIAVFLGNYADYIRECRRTAAAQQREIDSLRKSENEMKKLKEKEIQNSAKKRHSGARDNNKMGFNYTKSRGTAASDKRSHSIQQKIDDVRTKIANNRLPEVLVPNFVINGKTAGASHSIVNISDGQCGYTDTVVTGISLSLSCDDKISISGDNGSGKTTLIKAIFGDGNVWTKGMWVVPKQADIGYVDQHYGTLGKSVEDTIRDQAPEMTTAEIRKHLSSFLFRKNEEVLANVDALSGGEKARLSLAKIAAKVPKLLILDEITNNVDIETKDYICQVLKKYPGAMIIISHEDDFLEQLPLTCRYMIKDGRFMRENR